METYIEKAFLEALQVKGKEIAERLMKEYHEKFSKELNEAVMGITLNISKEVNIASVGNTMVITLRDKRES